ncbi:AraC family transcriptional regulator [Actinoplanes sp. NEAU-A12]|uniref:AraC family transcriptional regulator n=1 Tax=Actinoplanes sandaracinus TaxID=3045177 RepID=A0ABT6WZG7_9ACTN|nr:AraC family transcriptional regulator [Actinoplanes sandaracinus]MDI6105134.1 AraC family transcriptional regulator [Actinoplanes sandaracinus]
MQRALVETRDFAAAHEMLSCAYSEHRLRLTRPAPGFVFRSQAMLAADLSVDRMTYGGWVQLLIDPIDYVIVSTMLDGRLSLGPDQRDQFTAGDAALIPLRRPIHAVWDHFTVQALRIPLPAVTSIARRLGVEPADVRFDGSAAVSPAMNRHWLATVAYVSRMCAGPDPAIDHPLLRAGAVNTVAAAVLAVFPNTTMSVDYTAGPGRVPPAAVRRAMAYIDAHAEQPVTVEDIAAAAGVSVRGLQAAFSRHGDTTPTGYLRRARLRGAHRDLQAGDPTRGDTVAMIARRWGFANPGRFSVEYRIAYGQPPNRTLRT